MSASARNSGGNLGGQGHPRVGLDHSGLATHSVGASCLHDPAPPDFVCPSTRYLQLTQSASSIHDYIYIDWQVALQMERGWEHLGLDFEQKAATTALQAALSSHRHLSCSLTVKEKSDGRRCLHLGSGLHGI